MSYTGSEPMIPLRLTAVAAKPELGALAFILADQRYGPRNYAEITISDDLIRFDEVGGRNNYLALVSREIDRKGGHAFVTEYAHGTGDLVTQFKNAFVPAGNDDAAKANEALIALLEGHAYLTRLYTRISPEEMTVDPVFVPASSQVDVSNIHDASASTPCAPAPSCTFSDCGTKGMCLPVDARTDGCYCDPDTTAVATPTFGGQAIYCEPVTTDVLGSSADDTTCKSIDCGEGACMLLNGNPTCQCTPGHVAMALLASTSADASVAAVRCVSQGRDSPDAGGNALGQGLSLDAGSSVLPLDAGAGPASEARAAQVARPDVAGCSCTVRRAAPAGGAGLLGLLLAIGSWRRAGARDRKRVRA